MKHRILVKTLVTFLFICLSFVSLASEEFFDYQKSVLDNGATIVSKYVPESSLVTVRMRVLSGLSNEGEYAGSGISHFLEHLLFKGTSDKGAKEIRQEIKSMGGIVNGATGLDSAEYYMTVPNENFTEALDLLVDMVTRPVFTSEEFEIERDVILKEIKMRRDDPITRRMQLLFAEAYRQNVYKHPIIGYEKVFKTLAKEDILAYHAAAYTPDRMVLAVVGGIAGDEAIDAAREKLSGLERGRIWQVDIASEPRQISEAKSSFPADITLGYLALGFHTTSLYSPDLYPADVMDILLGGGNDSRLYKRLVKDKQLLYTISSVNYTPKYPGLFIITGIGDPDKLEEARKEVFAVIEDLKDGNVRDEEIERAKNMVISEYLHSHERIDSIASTMTNSEMLTGDAAFFKKYVDEIKKVDKERVKESALKYLKRDNSTTVFLMPRDFGEKAEKGEKMKTAEGEVKEAVLGNGLKVIVKRREELPLVSVSFATGGGLRAETEEDNGISNLTASLLLKGTKKRSEAEIIPAIERMGGEISTFSGMNSLGLAMDVLSKDLNEALVIFEDVLRNATFPEEEILKQKKRIMAAIKEQETDIFENGMIHLRRLIYGDHPYSMRTSGEVETVSSISRRDILDFFGERFVPEGSVITVAGDVDIDETINTLTKQFSSWRGRPSPLKEKEVPPLGESRKKDIFMKKEQALFLVGLEGVTVTDERRFALDVISSLLSGSDGLLFYAAREEKGLAYASGAASIPAVETGYFMLYVATTEENLKEAGKTVLDAISKLTSGQIGEEEIASSRRQLISQHAYSLETNSALSMTMALDELYGLGFLEYEEYPEKINAVTKDDIVECAKEVFDMDRSATVIVHSEQ